MPTRVTFLWHSVSGYMAACWRALAKDPSVEVSVIAGRANPNFKDDVVRGLNVSLIPEADLNKPDVIAALTRERRPDVIVICGWFLKGLTALAFNPEFASAKIVMGMDTPRRGTLRQLAGKYLHRKLFQRVSRVVVPGERAFLLARDLGFSDAKIRRGLYGVDHGALAPLLDQRLARPEGWPRRWLFMGRYHPDKDIETLIAAYGRYRAAVQEPWPLTTLGSGEQRALLTGVEGIEDRGFVQPAEQPGVIAEHGVFVLASRYDPWPLVVVEACAAGLPIVCTEACGSSVELVRPYFNGLTCAPENPGSLADAMIWMHRHAEDMPEFGRRSVQLASAYSAQTWARRWSAICAELSAVQAEPANLQA